MRVSFILFAAAVLAAGAASAQQAPRAALPEGLTLYVAADAARSINLGVVRRVGQAPTMLQRRRMEVGVDCRWPAAPNMTVPADLEPLRQPAEFASAAAFADHYIAAYGAALAEHDLRINATEAACLRRTLTALAQSVRGDAPEAPSPTQQRPE
ncbi:MAG: hypothetical protein AB7J28_04270 [Hyphomonadaceae bacterium]